MTRLLGILALVSSREEAATHGDEQHGIETPTMTGELVTNYSYTLTPGGTLTNVGHVDYYVKLNGKMCYWTSATSAPFSFSIRYSQGGSIPTFTDLWVKLTGSAPGADQAAEIVGKFVDSDHVQYVAGTWQFRAGSP